ncbi:MAG: LysM peptidoglycan-binding domain-containing protein [Oscillibacter sp.]|jgi:spore germination protein|nr:LysM peptidoglycan-binding domain-containing protein [Oscillibacter sp.]
MIIHIAAAGETVYSIARRYGTDPARLAEDNEVPASGALAVGQTLVIRLAQEVHAVASGETLTSIAALYGVTVRQLWQNNWSLGGKSELRAGQDLVIADAGEKLGTAVANGYAYPFIDRDLLLAQTPYLSCLTPFTYGITAEGDLLALEDDALLAAARTHGTKPVMHLSTYTEDDRFDSERARLVLTDYSVQDTLIEEIRLTLNRKGFAGLDVDFEYLPSELAEPYAAFLGRCQRLLSASGYFVWAALAPKTSADQPGLLYEGHDYAKIGAAVDAVLLMTYEWERLAHRSESPAIQRLFIFIQRCCSPF